MEQVKLHAVLECRITIVQRSIALDANNPSVVERYCSAQINIAVKDIAVAVRRINKRVLIIFKKICNNHIRWVEG